MFLSISKTKDGYQFRNGPRRMQLDEVMRRCPVEWVRTFNPEAAKWMENRKFKVVFTCDQWCLRWGDNCGVSKVEVVGFNHISYTGGALVRFNDHGETRESILYPRDVAEVIGYNRWHIDATFDDQARLIVENNPIA